MLEVCGAGDLLVLGSHGAASSAGSSRQHLAEMGWEVPGAPSSPWWGVGMQRPWVQHSPAGRCASFPLGSVVLLVAVVRRELRRCVCPLVFAFGFGLQANPVRAGEGAGAAFICGTVHGVTSAQLPLQWVLADRLWGGQ